MSNVPARTKKYTPPPTPAAIPKQEEPAVAIINSLTINLLSDGSISISTLEEMEPLQAVQVLQVAQNQALGGALQLHQLMTQMLQQAAAEQMLKANSAALAMGPAPSVMQ